MLLNKLHVKTCGVQLNYRINRTENNKLKTFLTRKKMRKRRHKCKMPQMKKQT